MSSILATELPGPPEARTPIYAMRWGAIFAGLAVGLSLHLLLMLLGAAGGLTALDARDVAPDASAAALIAGIWNGVSMLVAAFTGGYVAARASGLKRTNDGLLHGAVAWGATTLLTAMLATSAIGSAVGGAFGALRPVLADMASRGAPAVTAGRAGGAAASPLDALNDQLRSGRRNAAVATLRDRFGLSEEQAARVADGLGSARAQADAATPDDATGRAARKAEQASDAAVAALWWLFGAVLLSLIAGLAGGALGVRGAANRFRVARRDRHAQDIDPIARQHDLIRPELHTGPPRAEPPRYTSDPRIQPGPPPRR